MVERVRNVIKRDSKKAKGAPSEEVPEPKRHKKVLTFLGGTLWIAILLLIQVRILRV